MSRSFFLLSIMSISLYSELVYFTKTKSESTSRAFTTSAKSEANCVIKWTKWSGDAQGKFNGLWKETRTKASADRVVYMTSWKSEADLIIYETNSGRVSPCQN